MTMPIRILMADDHFVVRQGMRQIIGLFPDMVIVGEAGDGQALLSALDKVDPQLLLLDMTMPGISGVELIAQVRARRPRLPILILSMHKDTHVALGAIRAGANGYITKDSDPALLAVAIRKVAMGKRYVMPDLAEDMVFESINAPASRLNILSPREREILALLVSGHPIAGIANHLHVSAKTISTHKMRLMQKLKVRSNAELILLANAEGLKPSAGAISDD